MKIEQAQKLKVGDRIHHESHPDDILTVIWTNGEYIGTENESGWKWEYSVYDMTDFKQLAL